MFVVETLVNRVIYVRNVHRDLKIQTISIVKFSMRLAFLFKFLIISNHSQK